MKKPPCFVRVSICVKHEVHDRVKLNIAENDHPQQRAAFAVSLSDVVVVAVRYHHRWTGATRR